MRAIEWYSNNEIIEHCKSNLKLTRLCPLHTTSSAYEDEDLIEK